MHPGDDLAAWACRSGGKTLTASILAALEFLTTEGLEARVLSGSQDQARNLYGYWMRWCDGPLRPRVEGQVRRQLSRVAGGRMEILAASHKRVRGPKVQRLFEDELDEIDPEIDTAAIGMLSSTPHIAARTVYTSTWHRVDGLMARLIETAESSGVRLHRWNVWEALARCPPSRHQQGEGCLHCRLHDPCREMEAAYAPAAGRKTGIAARGTGLLDVEDVAKAYAKMGQATWDCEYLCRRPAAKGLVFASFDPARHRLRHLPADLRVYRAIDWGHGVFVCLWIGEDMDRRAIVLDTYRAEAGTISQHADYILAHRFQDVAATFCDPAGRNRSDQTGLSNIELFRRRGIVCRYTTAQRLRSVPTGIGMIRDALCPTQGAPRLTYLDTEGNRIFVRAMQSYRNRRVNGVWLDEPQDPQPFEHIPDALRYYFINRTSTDAVAMVGYSTG